MQTNLNDNKNVKNNIINLNNNNNNDNNINDDVRDGKDDVNERNNNDNNGIGGNEPICVHPSNLPTAPSKKVSFREDNNVGNDVKDIEKRGEKKGEKRETNSSLVSLYFSSVYENVTNTFAYITNQLLRTLTVKDYIVFLLFFIGIIIAQGMMIFGENFYLFSFHLGMLNSYSAALLPAIFWAMINIVLLTVYVLVMWIKFFYLTYHQKEAADDEKGGKKGPEIICDPSDKLIEGESGDVRKADEIDKIGRNDKVGGNDGDKPRFLTPVLLSRFLFWTKDKELAILLVLIGALDSISGITSVYSVSRVPVMIQTTLYASGSIWVFIMHRIFYQETSLKFSFLMVVSFILLIISLNFIIIAHLGQKSVKASFSLDKGNIGWFIILISSVIFPAIYNVLQGRFLARVRKFSELAESQKKKASFTEDNGIVVNSNIPNNITKTANLGIVSHNGNRELSVNKDQDAIKVKNAAERKEKGSAGVGNNTYYKGKEEKKKEEKVDEFAFVDPKKLSYFNHTTPFTTKLVILSGDYLVQVVVTLLLLPLDSLPWFGDVDGSAASGPRQTWGRVINGVNCLFECENNGVFFLIYALGFWFVRMFSTILNLYSPTMCAFIFQTTSPILTLSVMIFPVFSVRYHMDKAHYKNHTSKTFTILALFCLIISTLLYIILNQFQRYQKEKQKKDKEEEEEKERQKNIAEKDINNINNNGDNNKDNTRENDKDGDEGEVKKEDQVILTVDQNCSENKDIVKNGKN